MGTDLIAKVGDSFERQHRGALAELEQATLFSGAPTLKHALTAVPAPGHTFCVGEQYRLVLRQPEIFVVRGVEVVGQIERPPRSIIDSMCGPLAAAHGRIAAVSAITGKADLVLE